MPVKTFTPQRAAVSNSARPGARRNSPARQQLPLRSLPDCLLAAYDEVSHRAFERFVARGSHPGNEIADWRAAEKDLFSPVDLDFENTPEILYALATIAPRAGSQIQIAPAASSTLETAVATALAIEVPHQVATEVAVEVAIEVAIEDRWLLLWVHPRSAAVREKYQEDLASSADHQSRPLDMKWIEWEDLHNILRDSENSSGTLADSDAATDDYEPPSPVIARPFCVVELPADVDVSRSSAVFSDGLLAIRMPKMKPPPPQPLALTSEI
jgi:Protein of unknown function (DUF2934)